jgi:phage terminase small subunit
MTPKQEDFATALAAGMTQAAAYRHAFPHTVKWRDSAVWTESSKLAALPEVCQRVEELRAKACTLNEITVERIARELAYIAFGNKRDVMAWGPGGVKLKDSAELTDAQAALVAEVSETTTKDGGSLKLKTHDKVRALELLGRMKGAFIEKVEHSGTVAYTKVERAVVDPEDGQQ